MTHDEMRGWIGERIRGKGFWDDGTGQLDGLMFRLSLAQTEVCEAIQEFKRHWGKDGVDHNQLRDTIAEECADTAIRLYDAAAFGDISFAGANSYYDPPDVGPTDRIKFVNRLGKVASLVGGAFEIVESCLEDGEGDRLLPVDRTTFRDTLFTAIDHLGLLCRDLGRDLNAAIEKKMAVNMQRPFKYGTPSEGQPVQSAGAES